MDEMSTGSVDPSSSSSSNCQIKSCADCRTTTTPLWRAGPSGPKSLCNACGIRYRKSRRAAPAPGLTKEKEESGVSLELQMMMGALWEQKSMIQKQRRRRRRLLGEEEQAAFLLMALSSGFLDA